MPANVISETFFPNVMASAFERARAMLCSSLPIKAAVTPPNGNNQKESVARM